MSTPASTFGAIDFPLDGATIAREGFIVQGFAFAADAGPFARVVVHHDGVEIGSTGLHHRRRDLPAVIPTIWNVACGYRLTATLPPAAAAGSQSIEVCASFRNGTSWRQRRQIISGSHDYRQSPYGGLLRSDIHSVYGRRDIYSEGPPSPVASAECVALLDSYLEQGEGVIDVGCGVGAYGPPLLDAGVAWQGCEINASFVGQARECGLPVALVEGNALPFESGAFDAALCIEVLEHVADYQAFLAEVRRITRKRVFVSVPNAEAIAVLADQLVVPWHLLEADHKNFFTRAGLCTTLERHFQRVEVVPYGAMPLLSSNGGPVYYHLFAIAEC